MMESIHATEVVGCIYVDTVQFAGEVTRWEDFCGPVVLEGVERGLGRLAPSLLALSTA
jgi:hypothetical protein